LETRKSAGVARKRDQHGAAFLSLGYQNGALFLMKKRWTWGRGDVFREAERPDSIT
jgi:hypothetical protein